jgi:hypothetical protein
MLIPWGEEEKPGEAGGEDEPGADEVDGVEGEAEGVEREPEDAVGGD